MENHVCLDEPNQRPRKQISHESQVRQPTHPICHCGDIYGVVICKTQTNTGCRFYGCAGYVDHITNPNGV